MTTEFKQAKATIRAAVAAAPRATVESILEAAREGRVPWEGGGTCLCVSQRIAGRIWPYSHELSMAYLDLGHCAFRYTEKAEVKSDDPQRQAVLIAILRADLRRRDREMVKALVESAHEREAPCVR